MFLDFLPLSKRVKATDFGDTANRGVLFTNFGIDKWIIKSSHILWDGFVEVNGRFGDIGWLAAKNSFEVVFENTYLIDAGVSLGTGIKYRFNRFFFGAEVKQSFYFYIYQKGDEYDNILTASAPRFTLTASVGCGFYLGKN